MLDELTSSLMKSHLEGWQEVSEMFTCETTFEEKFAPLLNRRYDAAVVSLDRPSPSFPKFARARLDSGVRFARAHWKVAQLGHPKLTGRQRKHLEQRHRVKREQALLVLAHDQLLDALRAVAECWGLGRRYFLIDPSTFWCGGVDGAAAWESTLCWFTIEHLREHGQQDRDAERALAEKYAGDLDFDALTQGRESLRSRLPINQFSRHVRALAGAHGLSTLWDRSIEALLLGGRLIVPYHDARLVFRLTEGSWRLFIELLPETRDQDGLLHVWRRAQAFQGEVFPGGGQRQRESPSLAETLSVRPDEEGEGYLGELIDELYPEAPLSDQTRLMELLRKRLERLNARQAKALCQAAGPHVPRWAAAQMAFGRPFAREWRL